MGRAYPRFLLSTSTTAKSKGTFIIHTLDPAFIVEPTFNEIRQIIDIHMVKVFNEGTYYFDNAKEIAENEIPKWWRFSGIHDSCHPADKIIGRLQKLDYLRNIDEHYTVEEAQQVIKIIFPSKAKSFNNSVDSYDIKHDLERVSQLFLMNSKKYCGNDTVKQALINEGFKIRQKPNSSSIVVNISDPDLNIIRPIGLHRINRYSMMENF